MPLHPPAVVFLGRRWTQEELALTATAWWRMLRDRFPSSTGPIAMVMANDPPSVALFFALSCFEAPLVLLPLDLAPWRSDPPLPLDTQVVLAPTLGHLDREVGKLGVAVTVLHEEAASTSPGDEPPFMAAPGLVLFTSGSTGLPRPVYRTTPAVLDGVRAALASLGMAQGGGVVTSLPLARAFGFNHGLIAATLQDATLGLQPRFDPGPLLRLFETEEYQYWPGTPVMADLLSRAPIPTGHPAPQFCISGGRTSASLAARFLDRFGVPLRQLYGTTETGTISLDAAPADEVRSETAGRPLPEVALRVGDDPGVPMAEGVLGRIWLSSRRYLMEGYGFPPDLLAPALVDGWWPLPDVGHLDTEGRVTIAARFDDCFRTAAGHLVNPATVARALEDYPDVTDVAVVPLAGPKGGPWLGVLVEGAASLDTESLRAHLWRSLPRWTQPRVLKATNALPRLANGRIDRQTCIARLEPYLDQGTHD
ncbi:MAG TPA: fatty acid--CoA ligase family protein [Candidatus Methylomirabilis sp.]|nr:fatty acid--CoA ligase family protein [Candidatus Methylomirabilis sp.]